MLCGFFPCNCPLHTQPVLARAAAVVHRQPGVLLHAAASAAGDTPTPCRHGACRRTTTPFGSRLGSHAEPSPPYLGSRADSSPPRPDVVSATVPAFVPTVVPA